ncbi:hypothetical protein FQN60_011566 [Etheostoma spectabile]|uniref:Uncharacterized protein n=1 Tax=Etheostoma spectabile TaxID=54343 RepID=A0A5J5DM40_9PERO|nr:hypothetical protein FQN60_011566 [Etheostoma spectabile]
MDSGKTHSALLYKRKGRVSQKHFNLLFFEGSLDLLVSPKKNGFVTETMHSPAGCCSCSLDSALSSVTMTNENSTEKFCINTQGKMAKAFLKCWERINKDESRKMECIDRKRKSE